MIIARHFQADVTGQPRPPRGSLAGGGGGRGVSISSDGRAIFQQKANVKGEKITAKIFSLKGERKTL
jgi:hypothetical protein